jgi:hypothetical protein
MNANQQAVRRAVALLRTARSDLEILATDGRLASLQMGNGASALDWAGTALTNLRAALAMLDRGEAPGDTLPCGCARSQCAGHAAPDHDGKAA